MTRRFRHVEWTLKRMDAKAWAHIQCVSGEPRCGAVPPGRPGNRSPEDVLAWTEEHFRVTGHRRYDRVLFDRVQWDPPEGLDPHSLPGVST
ncbi:DUF7848 domain-containing protein [Streptomyces sp. NPDC002454]